MTPLASIGSADRTALLWVVDHRDGFLTPLFEGITYAATGGAAWVALALLLAWRKRAPLLPIGIFAAAVVGGADGWRLR
jgi:hypothetical protein